MDNQTRQVPDMRSGISKNTQLIKQTIDRAVETLRQSNPNDDDMGDGALLFFGNQHDAIPRLLITDPVLDPNEIFTWQIIRVCVHNPAQPAYFPKQEELAAHLKASRPIASRCVQALRATRWLTQINRVRAESGQFRQAVYALHDEPLNLADTIYLDPDYLDFLEQSKQSKNRRIRNIANLVMTHTENLVMEGIDITRGRTQLEQSALRLNSSVVMTSHKENRSPCKESLHGETESQPCKESSHGEKQDEESHVKNFYMVENPEKTGFDDHVKNLYTVYATGKQPCKESSHGGSSLSARACGSSKIYTTTTEQEKSEKKPLRFPSAFKPQEIQFAKTLLIRLSFDDRQFVLDYVADRIQAAKDGTIPPIKNPIGYLQKIITQKANGELQPSSFGLRSTQANDRPQEPAIDEAERKRREMESYRRQMEAYGMEVDPETGIARAKS